MYEHMPKSPNFRSPHMLVDMCCAERCWYGGVMRCGFRRHCVKPGDLIGIQLNNSVENLAAVLGCIFAGATIVLVKTSLTERENTETHT
ncbi:hypothetical protein HPB48_015639 [Haemaphysalis longicornis]|uniref:AMP-dependent synthetase/ligase domain-containing protein n=1 Tax=Haemaphysalis longicornis TaxID=44386 RepID=A0A9J6G2U9_HAELO|nr:hypothetical protein HPB48_015639 [Haemaphysalis longicornis]